jgi:putative ABC transport system ATP-binding protein
MRLEGVRHSVRAVKRGAPVEILRGVDLDVGAEESVAVVGRSGSGKSTLLAVLGLLDRPCGGRYVLGGCETGGLSERERDRLRSETFGFIFQRFCLLGHLTAQENVEVALAHRGIRRGRSTRAQAALGAVGLADRTHHRPAQLSGGEQQRVALARALSTQPAAVLADEPTGSLDEATADGVMRLIRGAVAEAGASLVVVTHDLAVAASMDRCIQLVAGTVADAS